VTINLQEIYNQLATEKWSLTEREFSKEYLGKCETYFAYLKSTGKVPSADALLRLWGKLKKDKQLYEASLELTNSETQRQFLVDWIALYERLQGEVFEAIKKRAVIS